ncbi:MAG: aa3-type cytochrome c oxidase subunit IV [Pseudomonadota bacterium]
MSDHEQGKMDITEQERTFEGFIKFWIWLFAASAIILIFLAIFNS